MGPLDGLINCLGLFLVKGTDTISFEEIEELVAVNLTALIFSCKCAILKERGHIINIASSAYSRGRGDYAVYAAAKAGVVNFTQGFAEERPELLVNAVVPQRTLTRMRQESFPDEDPTTLLDPIKVAEAVVNLLKDDQTTGSLLEVRRE